MFNEHIQNINYRWINRPIWIEHVTSMHA